MNPFPSCIGIFDSGVGGLSVLKALRQELPHENLLYFSDSAFAPYGERTEQEVVQRSEHITATLIQQGAKALVIACNTATAAAVHHLRQHYPHLPIVGVEPALKPASISSQTRQVGVLATQRTLASQKFANMLQNCSHNCHFHLRAATGLALAIELGDYTQIKSLLIEHLKALGDFGHGPGQIDTLVLGCTHYPLVIELIQELVGPTIHVLDNAPAIAKHTHLLLKNNQTNSPLADVTNTGSICFQTSGDLNKLQQFAASLGL